MATTHAQQCLGRLQSKDVVYFEAGPKLHRNKPLLFLLPRRCVESKSIGDLCTGCNSKKESTQASLEKRGNKYIPNQACLLHGTIVEPIPIWSRLYKGVWWYKQVEMGYTASADTLEKATNAFLNTHKDNEIPVVDMKLTKTAESAKEGSTKKGRPTRKKVATPIVNVIKSHEEVPVAVPAVAAVVPAVVPAVPAAVVPAAVAAVPAASVAPKKVKKPAIKKVVVPKVETSPLLVITDMKHVVPTEVIDIEVVKYEMEDGRVVWLNKAKDKLYDMKYNYLGRKKGDSIDSSFPDSDRE